MTEKGMQERYKSELRTARERFGKSTEERRAQRNERAKIQKVLLEELAAGPKTVPELAEATGFDSQTVLWHVAALRKYNQVEDGGKRGDYVVYARK